MSRQSCRSRLHAACRSMLAGALALFFLSNEQVRMI